MKLLLFLAWFLWFVGRGFLYRRPQHAGQRVELTVAEDITQEHLEAGWEPQVAIISAESVTTE